MSAGRQDRWPGCLSISLFAMLVIASMAWSETAGAQEYNLRTVPATPQASAPFVAAFDDTDCVDWILVPDAEPPVVAVQGSTVRLEVERIAVADCSNQPRTNTLSVPALPAGNYQLELIGRAYLSPGNDLLVETVAFEIAPAVATSAFTIPASSRVSLAMLVGLMLSLGYTLSRKKGMSVGRHGSVMRVKQGASSFKVPLCCWR